MKTLKNKERVKEINVRNDERNFITGDGLKAELIKEHFQKLRGPKVSYTIQ